MNLARLSIMLFMQPQQLVSFHDLALSDYSLFCESKTLS
jgi:hypothetical protein